MMTEKKGKEMKRRELLLKAAEAAALALFGSMGLAEVSAAVSQEIRERNRVNCLASQIAADIRAFAAIPAQVYYYSPNQSCSHGFECDQQTVTCSGVGFSCGLINQPYHCGPNRVDFDCNRRFTCISDFGCHVQQFFNCSLEFYCRRTINCSRYTAGPEG